MAGRPQSGLRRFLNVLVAAFVLTLAAAPFAGVVSAGRGSRTADLSGTWINSDGVTWTFSGDGQGSYTATYHGTGAHSKLVGTVTATYDGEAKTLAGTVHIEEPNQVEGGPPTIAEGTLTADYLPRQPPLLDGSITTPTGNYPFYLTCNSGSCTKTQCSFVRVGEEAVTDEQRPLFDDIDFLLSSRLPSEDCSVTLQTGKDKFITYMSTDQLAASLGRITSDLSKAFPQAPDAVRAKVAESVKLAELLRLITTDGQPAFPGMRTFLDSGAFARMAAAALKPPGDTTAADALRDVIRLLALNDATGAAK
jgi:hypothetical protein